MDYIPEDTDDCFYIEREAALNDIIELAEEKWGTTIAFNRLQIEAEYIHTDCLGHDQYDSRDYTNYLCIRRIES